MPRQITVPNLRVLHISHNTLTLPFSPHIVLTHIKSHRIPGLVPFSMNVVQGFTHWVTDCQIIADERKEIGLSVSINPISFG